MSNGGPPPGIHVTYSRQFRRCNKPDCPACREDSRGHGPYWFAYWREEGRQHSRYLGRHQPAEVVSAPAGPDLNSDALRVRTLGDFSVWLGADLVQASAWAQRRPAQLLKCLISAPGYRLHREGIVEILWPNVEPSQGAKRLRHTIYGLRRILGQGESAENHVRREGDMLALIPAPEGEVEADWLDALAFERAATAVLAGIDATACRAAIALYTGDYLPEDLYEEWALTRRETLRGLYLSLLSHLAELRERQGGHAEAVRCLRAVLRIDPCNERSTRALMRLQAAAGRHDEAIRTYLTLVDILRRDLDLEPESETTTQYQAVVADKQEAAARRTNLPLVLTSFLGREQEVIALIQLLRGSGGARTHPARSTDRPRDLPRLVTMIGSGGCGKTRMAIELGHEVRDHYADGVWLVELASIPPDGHADPTLVAGHICTALNVAKGSGGPALTALCDFLGSRAVLLILDNCEHLPEACTIVISSLLQNCTTVQILVTSRQALGIMGEVVRRLPSLEVPSEHRQVDHALPEPARYASIRLLVERAAIVHPGFALTGENWPAAVEICRRLDGIPLAIELAAARLSMLSIEEVAARLSDRFRLLTAGNEGALPRHQTLRAVMDWSYQLLTQAEQALLRGICVFAGTWTLEAAERLCADLDDGTTSVLDLVARLVNKSLVQVDDDFYSPTGETRYRLLETVRHYAAQRLRAAGEEEATRGRHADLCLDLAERAVPKVQGSEQGEWLARLEMEHDNMRAALQWSIHESGNPEIGLKLACQLVHFWVRHGHYREGYAWLEHALNRLPTADRALRAKALKNAANLVYWLGDMDRARRNYEEALVIHRALGDSAGAAVALMNIGNVAMEKEDFATARLRYEESLALLGTAGDPVNRVRLLNNLGVVAQVQGDYARALTIYEQCYDIWRELGDTWSVATQLNNIGEASYSMGDLERAMDCFKRSLIMRRDLADRDGVKSTLQSLGYLAHRLGHDEDAARVLAAAETLATELGAGLPGYQQTAHDQCLEAIGWVLGAESFSAVWAAGRAMTYEGALEHALAMVGEGNVTASPAPA